MTDQRSDDAVEYRRLYYSKDLEASAQAGTDPRRLQMPAQRLRQDADVRSAVAQQRGRSPLAAAQRRPRFVL